MKLGSLTFDTVEYASRANAVLGIRDSGKTYTATGLAEQLLDANSGKQKAGIPFVVLDPTGVWRFLRVPGAGKGYPVIVVGGADGDLPLKAATAGKIVEAALRGAASIVFNLSGQISKGEMRKIVTDCVNVLMDKNPQYGLRHVFIEEAAEFVPQRVSDGIVYAAVEKLVRVGGNMGLGVTLVNPRTQNLNKEVLELCDNIFLHRQKGTNSLKHLQGWFDAVGAEAPKVMVQSISKLKSGECFAWLRDMDEPKLVHVQQKNSFHPNRRDLQALTGKQVKRVDAADLIAALKHELPQVEAEMNANDPALLRAEIARLTKEVAAKPAAAPPAPKVDVRADNTRVRSEGYNAGYAAGKKLAERYKAKIEKAWTGTYQRILIGNAEWLENVVAKRDLPTILREVALDIPKDIDRLWGEVFASDVGLPPTVADFKEVPKTEPRAMPVSQSAPSVNYTPGSGDLADLGGPEQRIMKSLAWWKAMGFEYLSRPQVAFLARYSPTSSSFTNPLGALRTKGLITYPSEGSVALTDEGSTRAAPPDDVGLDHASLRKAILKELDGPQTRIMEPLMEAYPDEVDRPTLAGGAQYSPTSSSFTNPLGSLRTLGLLTYPRDGYVKAARWLFEGDAA